LICRYKHFWKFITCSGWCNIRFLWTNFSKWIFLFGKLVLMMRSRSWVDIVSRACKCSVIKVIKESFLASSMSIYRIRISLTEVKFSHYFKFLTIEKPLFICNFLSFILIILLIIGNTCKKIGYVLHTLHFFELVCLQINFFDFFFEGCGKLVNTKIPIASETISIFRWPERRIFLWLLAASVYRLRPYHNLFWLQLKISHLMRSFVRNIRRLIDFWGRNRKELFLWYFILVGLNLFCSVFNKFFGDQRVVNNHGCLFLKDSLNLKSLCFLLFLFLVKHFR